MNMLMSTAGGGAGSRRVGFLIGTSGSGLDEGRSGRNDDRMRLALAQINPTVGDVQSNVAVIIAMIRRAREAGARLVVFPELTLLGYPPKDLLLKPQVIARCQEAIEEVAAHCVGIAAVVGLALPTDKPRGRHLYNAAALCDDGRVVARHVKSLLPTYDVFDEHRYFEPGPAPEPVTLNTEEGPVRLGISVCEDLWNDERFFDRQLYHENPISQLADAGADLLINCSASPFGIDKHRFRLDLMRGTAQRHACPVVYCNQVGANDELVFDGQSCVFDAKGNLIGHAAGFVEELLVVDVPVACEGDAPQRSGGMEPPAESLDTMASLYQALVLGLGDYCRKCGFERVVLGLSGGIDSAVSAVIAAAAVGGDRVTGVTMPSRYSSEGSVNDAVALATRLGMTCHTVPIAPAHEAYEAMLPTVLGGPPRGLTEENLQARLRGVLLMAVSNDTGALLVTTGNKSELAVGYCTLYGDMCGGLAVLADVPKTMVYDLARWINTPACPLYDAEREPVIPVDSITKPPSAELRADQVDQDSLPPYEVLDDIVERYVEREASTAQIVEQTGYDAALVLKIAKLIDRNEYKRRQAAPGLKVTGRAFGSGRRMPIAQRWDPAATLHSQHTAEAPVTSTT